MWGDLFLLIAAVISIAIIFWKYPNEVKDIKFTSIIALSIYMLSELMTLLPFEIITDTSPILFIISLSLIFVILLMIIRKLKPIVFQYPYPIVFLPLLLPIAFLFVMDTIIVEQIILASIQSVVIVVLFLITSGYGNYLEKRGVMYVGLFLLIVSFVLHWMIKEIVTIEPVFWKILLSIGMVFIIYSLNGLINKKINNPYSAEVYE